MSNRTNNKNGNRRSNRINWIVIVLAAVLACSILSSALVVGAGFLTESFSKKDPTTWFSREINPDNLLKRDDYIEANLIEENQKGLKFNWKDDGSVVLSGMHDDSTQKIDEYYYLQFATVMLPAGTYTLSTGNENVDVEKFGLYLEYTGSDSVYVGAEDYEFTLTQETPVRVSVFAKNQERLWGIQSCIRPVLVPEGSEVSFYL